MSDAASHRRLTTSALVVGYAMSRLDRKFLEAFRLQSWNAAYSAFGKALASPPKSIKNLRDEFDPLHPNERRGWADRAMLPSRVRVADELALASDYALIELVRSILLADAETTREAIDALAPPPGMAAAAAQRLATGRRAEEFVLANAHQVLGCDRSRVHDAREDLAGFDFKLILTPSIFVEVKGLQGSSGDILFSDREWFEARRHQALYWLVVVGNLRHDPEARLVENPARHLHPSCVFERSVRPTWRTRFAIGTTNVLRVAESETRGSGAVED